MNLIDDHELEKLVTNGAEKFAYEIEPNIISKLQLYLTGKVKQGIEIFGIGPLEIRAVGFLFEYGNAINYAIQNSYRVFLRKDGSYFGQGSWILEFVKN